MAPAFYCLLKLRQAVTPKHRQAAKGSPSSPRRKRKEGSRCTYSFDNFAYSEFLGVLAV